MKYITLLSACKPPNQTHKNIGPESDGEHTWWAWTAMYKALRLNIFFLFELSPTMKRRRRCRIQRRRRNSYWNCIRKIYGIFTFVTHSLHNGKFHRHQFVVYGLNDQTIVSNHKICNLNDFLAICLYGAYAMWRSSGHVSFTRSSKQLKPYNNNNNLMYF